MDLTLPGMDVLIHRSISGTLVWSLSELLILPQWPRPSSEPDLFILEFDGFMAERRYFHHSKSKPLIHKIYWDHIVLLDYIGKMVHIPSLHIAKWTMANISWKLRKIWVFFLYADHGHLVGNFKKEKE